MAGNVIDILIKAKDQTKGAFKSAAGGMKDLGEAAEKSGESSKSFGEKFSIAMMGISQGIMVAKEVATAIRKIYEVAREGAELEYLESKFDNLTASIGVTSNALMVDLRQATGGIMSDAELMEGATAMMALGLAKTRDEAIRLATVTGALNMNMNQLVLTLTNQTTMRFDALGVSVDGFDEKVKKLEETGLSASDAFKEAFLQQAEEQIERVGSAVDETIGDFMRFESAWKNMVDGMKKDAAEGFGGVTAKMLSLFFEEEDWDNQFKRLRKQLQDAGIDVEEYKARWEDNENFAQWIIDHDIAADVLYDMDKSLRNNAVYDGSFSNAAINAADALQETETVFKSSAQAAADYYWYVDLSGAKTRDFSKLYVLEMGIATKANQEFLEAVGEITSYTGNFDTVIGLAEKYDDILAEIVEQEQIMADNPIGSEKWEEANTKAQELKQTMTELANQMVLDMYYATLAVGGFTDAEIESYFEMAAEMGIISKEASDQATEDFFAAKTRIEAESIQWLIDVKLNDPKNALGIKLQDQKATYTITTVNKLQNVPLREAAGGQVHAASGMRMTAPYLVGEVGPEPFFPATDGRVLSNSQAMSALRSGGRGMGVVNVTINTPFNFADSVWVERELAPYIQKALREVGV